MGMGQFLFHHRNYRMKIHLTPYQPESGPIWSSWCAVSSVISLKWSCPEKQCGLLLGRRNCLAHITLWFGWRSFSAHGRFAKAWIWIYFRQFRRHHPIIPEVWGATRDRVRFHSSGHIHWWFGGNQGVRVCIWLGISEFPFSRRTFRRVKWAGLYSYAWLKPFLPSSQHG